MRVLWLLLLVPMAVGQTQVFEVTTAEGEQVIAWDDTTEMPITVTVSCDYFLQPPSPQIRVQTSTDAPEAWGSDGEEIVFELGQECLDGSGVVSQDGVIRFTPTITATAGTLTDSYTRTSDSFIEYVGNHTLESTTTLSWTGGVLDIPMTITVDANGPTRVIFPGLNPGGGKLSGLSPLEFTGPGTQTANMTWTPPEVWDTATIRVEHASHCITQTLYDCTPTSQSTTWTITNDAPAEEKESPAIAVPLLLLAILVARR